MVSVKNFLKERLAKINGAQSQAQNRPRKYDQYDNVYAYDVQASDVQEGHDMNKHTRTTCI